MVRLDRIFYDFDKWNIRADAIPELEHLLAGALRGYPSMKIELSSHTDVRGSDAYNHYLSSQRAQVVVSYLIAQGIRPDRMVAKGYGETKLNKRLRKRRALLGGTAPGEPADGVYDYGILAMR